MVKQESVSLNYQNGMLHVNGSPIVTISADYPYYRDTPENWEDRLTKLRDQGVKIVSCYIPWRHHQLSKESQPDFTGQSQPNRNVMGFLNTCHELGLWVIAKPGPFIHAETNYGGLPDWVCPLADAEIEPFLRADDSPATWQGKRMQADAKPESWPLPAPFAPTFMPQVQTWLKAANREVIEPNLYPNGPVIMTQIANEGIYSDGPSSPRDYDFSASSLALFRGYLAEQYGDLDTYNQAHNSAFATWDAINPPREWQAGEQPADLLPYIDWGGFQAYHIQEVFRLWGECLTLEVPMMQNINPPAGAPGGRDRWMMRLQPENWPNIHYGFTNWIGDVSSDASARDRYLFIAKRATGINLEENWGFSKLYDMSYEDACTSFHQTLLALAGGATGFNVYTGVGTANWDDNLDNVQERPYPAASPITAEGEVTPKAEVMGAMAQFFNAHGTEFLACQPEHAAAWGIYQPYAAIGAWAESDTDSAAMPQSGYSMGQFQSQLHELQQDYGLVDLHTATADDLVAYPVIALHGSQFMARSIQEKLAQYAAQGGKLVISGEIPTLDEHFAAVDVLSAQQDQITQQAALDMATVVGSNASVRHVSGDSNLWVRSHPTADVHYVVMLAPASSQDAAQFEVKLGSQWHTLNIQTTRGGGAVLRIADGAITDALVKGTNYYRNHECAPFVTLDEQRLALEHVGDLVVVNPQ